MLVYIISKLLILNILNLPVTNTNSRKLQIYNVNNAGAGEKIL